MTLQRPTADIAYIIAKGHAGTTVLLDNLRFGPSSTTTTNSQGAYALSGLSAGTYRVHVVPPANWIGDPVADRTVTLAEGESLGQIDFAEHPTVTLWQNPGNVYDVDDNSIVAAMDALLLINALNAGKSGPLPYAGGPTLPPPFYDVNGDGKLLPIDAILVINALNASRGGSGESGGTAQGGGGTAGSGGSNGEGELLAAAFRSEHVVVLRGDRAGTSQVSALDVLHCPDCTCSNCVASAGQVHASTPAVGPSFSPLEQRAQSVASHLLASIQAHPLFAAVPAAPWNSLASGRVSDWDSLLNDLAQEKSRTQSRRNIDQAIMELGDPSQLQFHDD
jgi:hypothetical protein